MAHLGKRKVSGRQATRDLDNGMSSDDEDLEMPTAPMPAQRASTRRTNPRVDLSKLDAASLRRYRQHYKLGDAGPGAKKEDLMPAVARHFQHYVVDENDTLVNFALALKKASIQNGTAGGFGLPGIGVPAGVKKPRGSFANGTAKGKLR